MISNSIIQKKLYSPVITGVLLCDNYENDVVKPPAIMSGAIASPDYSGVYDELTKSYSPANIGVLFDNSQDSLGISSAYEADVLSNIYDVSSCESIGESSSVGFNLTGVGYCDNACSEKTSPVFTGVSIYENDSYLLQSLLCSTDFDTVVKDNNYMNYNVVDETNNVLLASSICPCICPWFTKTAGSIDFEYSPDMSGNILKDVSTKFCEMNINNFSSVHEAVFYSGKPNFAYCKIPVRSNFNIQLWEQLLEDYHDKIVVEFLKASNLVSRSSTSFNSREQLIRDNVVVSEKGILLLLKWSKTRQNHDYTHQVSLCCSVEPSICPARAYKHLVSLIPGDKNAPVFALPVHGKLLPLSRSVLLNRFRELIVLVGLDPSVYSFHSLRHGGATLATKAGIPEILLKHHGDLRSDCFQTYIKQASVDMYRVMSAMNYLIGS
ncbi:unnamed protein product [Mytilus edulis]|uniref:Tyr recombinase domain-containing protein n=1 Tax=Mytilus edulis TaxID=6550 RepID=A0A8S3UX41_MYTED|nr:unnamed protein product [Mytilus edulis]